MHIQAFLLFALSIPHSSESSLVIAVCQSKDTCNTDCLNGSDENYTVDKLPQETLGDNILIRICSRHVIVSEIIKLNKMRNVTVIGYDKAEIECSSHSEAGLNLLEIADLKLAHFRVNRCNFKVIISPRRSDNINAGINIQNCSNVSIIDLIVTNSSGTGLALFNNHEEVAILDSLFNGNGLDNKTGGNGIYLEVNDSISTSSIYIIHNCSFLFNIANTGKDNKKISRFDKGGGLCVYIINGREISINISNSTFAHNMALKCGGGMFSNFYGKTKNCTVTVTRSFFAYNLATYGGALYAGYLQPPWLKRTNMNCSYIFKFCTFMNNLANGTGGGTGLFSTKFIANKNEARLVFENCTWSDNKAKHGSAISLLPNSWLLYEGGYFPIPIFQNCHILSNNIMDTYNHKQFNTYTTGSGTVYCHGYTLVLRGTIHFRQNIGTALLMNYCVVYFSASSEVHFVNNTGHNGGAIYMLASLMFLNDNSNTIFKNNKAYSTGGAIYQYTPDAYTLSYSTTCFINYNGSLHAVKNRNITVKFIDNRAGIATTQPGYGHSIYASSLLPCKRDFEANCSIFNIFGEVGNFMYNTNRSMEIATDINHVESLDNKWSNDIMFIPGKATIIPFKNIDDLNQTIYSDYQVTIGNDMVKMGQNYSHIPNNTLYLYGKPNSEAKINLTSASSRQVALSFRAIMLPCPPGMILNENATTPECTCSLSSRIPGDKYNGIAACDYIQLFAYRFQDFWFGYSPNEKESENSLMSGYCPFGFCSYTTRLPSKADRKQLESMICSDSRTGILCGKCKPGHSVHYHSLGFKCKSEKYCKWGWLFYILSEILPVTIIFVVIIFFNISFTSGQLHGFIFYAQIVEMLQFTASQISGGANTVIRLDYLIYLFFNLDTFALDEISYCIWKGANSLDVLAFSYVTLTYSFLLIVVVMVTVSKCSCKCRYLGFDFGNSEQLSHFLSRNMLHGFSAFFILFYLHAMRASILILSPMLIQNKGQHIENTVVYYNGEMEWLKGQHLCYALPAIIIILLVSAPPSLLLIYPLHYKIFSLLHIAESSCIKALFHPLDKLKPFFDSFQGCYKDEYRFFSGLYFLYRFLLLINVAFSPIEHVHILTSIEICLMLLIHSVCQPYRDRFYNITDSLLFGNLAIINLITMYNFFATNSNMKPLLKISVNIWIQTVLIILPLLIFMLNMLSKINCIKKNCLNLTKFLWTKKSQECELRESQSYSYETFHRARASY